MRTKPLIAITCAFFAFLVVYELYSGYAHFRTNMYIKAKDTAGTFIAFRTWNTKTGAVYVPITAARPDPYMNTKDRTIIAGSTQLVRVNPAYMTHLVSNVLFNTDGITVRMISTASPAPQCRAHGWEKAALNEITHTGKETYYIDFSAPTHIAFRYMSPITAEKECTACHKAFVPGRISGGISVVFPITAEHNRELTLTLLKILAYLISASLVILLILNSRRKLTAAWEEKLRTISELEKEIRLREMSERALVSQTRSSSISEILSLVAHHWRQPLNNIGLIVQTMASEDNVKEIKTYGKTAIEIIKEMSDTITLFTSTIKADRSGKLNVKNMVFDTLRLLRPEFENIGIEIHIKCNLGGTDDVPAMTASDNVYTFCGGGQYECNKACDAEDIYIEGDEATFKQILLILLKNAYDSVVDLPSGMEKIIAITFARTGGIATISVCDSGAAISAEVRQRLFDPYFTTKGYQAGRGIGLFTAKSLTDNFHNARLYFDDSTGKCFIFEFKDCGK